MVVEVALSRVAAPLHRKDSDKVVHLDRELPGCLEVSRHVPLGQTGLGTPWFPPGGAAVCHQGEGGLDFPPGPVAPVCCRNWMVVGHGSKKLKPCKGRKGGVQVL